MATDDLQLDLAAGLVFAMILVYQVFMDEVHEPTTPADDSFKLTVIFREEPLTHQQLVDLALKEPRPNAEYIRNATYVRDERAKLASGVSTRAGELSGIWYNLRADPIVDYPAANAAGWECRLTTGGFSGAGPRYRAGAEGFAVEEAIGDETVEVQHTLDRITVERELAANEDAEIEIWDSAFRSFIAKLPSVGTADKSIWTRKFNLKNCLRETMVGRNSVSFYWPVVFGRIGALSNACSATPEFWSPCNLAKDCEAFIPALSLRRDSEASVAGLNLVNPAPGPADDAVQSLVANFLSFEEFGAFSCQATGIGVSGTDEVRLRLDGTPAGSTFREIRLLAVSVQSRSRVEPEIWTAWGDKPFPGELTLDGADAIRPPAGDVVRIEAPATLRFGL
ncbi:MAG: hypothetical protein KDK08_22385 [Rhizobiaceae bacterium]|nr:hypothetical protein [Rhizobiaceae bacterium]